MNSTMNTDGLHSNYFTLCYENSILVAGKPTPLVGQGSFVVIGVENAGQRRFGRQMMGNVLSGRGPVAFTGCG